MAIQRISTVAIFQTTLRDVNKVQANLLDLQQQISSGIKAKDFKGLNGKVEQFTALEAKMRKSQLYQENNAIAISRLQTTNTALDQILQLADDMENLVTLRRNPATGQSLAFEEKARSALAGLASQLNTTLEGRYLFGGTRTDTPPVIDDPQVPSVNAEGVPDASYYRGSQDDIKLRAQENYEITYNVRADEEGFQKLIAGIQLAISGAANNNDVKLGDSLTMIQEGIQEVIKLQGNVNGKIVELQQINERHESLELYWKGVTEDISKTDLVAASTQVAIDQSVLQASFQAFARINSLRLVDYL